jgi:hypothetical protein
MVHPALDCAGNVPADGIGIKWENSG